MNFKCFSASVVRVLGPIKQNKNKMHKKVTLRMYRQSSRKKKEEFKLTGKRPKSPCARAAVCLCVCVHTAEPCNLQRETDCCETSLHSETALSVMLLLTLCLDFLSLPEHTHASTLNHTHMHARSHTHRLHTVL